MTQVIDATTEPVTRAGGEAVRIRQHLEPVMACDERGREAERARLADADPEIDGLDRARQRFEERLRPGAEREARGEQRRRAPPGRCRTPSSGSAIASAITFGSTSRVMIETPMTCSASISSVTRITELRGHRQARAARGDDRRGHRPELAHYADADDVDDEQIGAVALELQRGKIA